MNGTTDSRWYRQPVMWLVVAIPLATVIAGFTTLWLATRSPDQVIAVAGPQGPTVEGGAGQPVPR
jgi:hypothetical protein